ncbi:MAG: hypothetical protein Fur0018_25330 [Anaerolineales bacterium]
MNDKMVLCPSCHRSIPGTTRYCAHCGVDLVLAAALEERRYTAGTLAGRDVTLTPEMLIPRLGERLVQQGVITAEQLQQALEYQQARAALGESCLLGQALLQLGMVEQPVLDHAITQQILQLQAALEAANRHLEERVEQRTNELQMALQRLAQLNQMKSNFISNVSHELRTPLAHIKGYLELLNDQMLGELNEDQQKAIGTALRSTHRLEQLIEALLQFSLATRGELSLDIQPVDLSAVLRAVCEQFAPAAQRKNIAFLPDIPDTPCQVRADRDKITWVVTQLLDNAIKFTPQRGRVTITLALRFQMAEITIADTGIGIPEARIAEIFEPFHQLDEANTRRYGGTGLGLALVKRILDAHGAPYRVESQLGQGTKMLFSLPLLAEQTS